jgi:hypothetical protein
LSIGDRGLIRHSREHPGSGDGGAGNMNFFEFAAGVIGNFFGS